MPRLAAAIIGAVLLGAIFGATLRIEAAWDPYICRTSAQGVVYGDNLTGRVCASWETGTTAWRWRMYGSTTVLPYSLYGIYTSLYGYDRCGSGSWLLNMSVSGYAFNNIYGSTPVGYSAYQNCTSDHYYRISSYHLAQLTGASPWLGFYGEQYW